MVGGSEHHSVYANPRQYPPKEQPILRPRAVYLSAGTQPLYLSRRPTPQLWWSSSSESRLQLHRNPQALWCVLAETAMHQCSFPVSYHPPVRIGSATGTRAGEHARVRHCTAAKKEGGSLIRGTQESDWAAALAPAEIEVRAGAVLPGSGGPEHQATRAVPQPTDNTCSASHHLAELREEKLSRAYSEPKRRLLTYFFNTHRP
jgi:hypothetical protein